MEMIFKNKIALTFLLLFIIGIFGYRLFGGTAEEYIESSGTVAGQDLVDLSDKLSRAQLSKELFSVPSYRYLTDFTIPLKVQPMGRNNPFGIIGKN